MTGDETDFLAAAWEEREEVVYPRVFRRQDSGQIYTLNEDVFLNRFSQPGVDPRWLHCGVLVFPREPGSASASIVTSGLSNAWNATGPSPAVKSGLGFELHLEVEEAAKWAVGNLLRVMAHQLLVDANLLPGEPLLADGVLLPLGGALVPDSPLTHFLATRSPYAPVRLELVTGFFDLLLLVGLTDGEADFVRARGWKEMEKRFGERTDSVVTDPFRAPVV